MDDRAIGVFDSGVGGISVLRELARLLPDEHFIYYGDTKNAPYGTRGEEDILALTLSVAQKLLARDVKALVIACNTMTSAAAGALRDALSIPVIGMEPALKPASLARRDGRVLVMATEATLRQSKFQSLLARYGEGALLLPCPGLMEFAERGDFDSPALDAFLDALLAKHRGEKIDAAVLGCTHYVFLKRAISKALPGVPLFDGNEGAARRLRTLLFERNALSENGGGVDFLSSDESAIPCMKALFTR